MTSTLPSAPAPAAAPPPSDSFPAYPASWYLFGMSAELRAGPVSKPLLGKQLVAFRTASGKAVVLDAHCAHLGADLGQGCVVGESIQCPFHNWQYAADGRCTKIPGLSEIPAFARQTRYPAEERHGYVFVFNGRAPLFPLPFFFDADPERYVAGRLFSYVADCSWSMNAAHAFDTQHFASVHDRRLLAPPQIDEPAPFARRNRYRAEVVGHTIFDRLLRRFAARTVEISLTICGGTFALVTGDFGRTQSRFMIVMHPLENGQTRCDGLVFAPRGALPLLDAARLELRRLFTRAYLADEARTLRGTRYRPASLTAADHDMTDFFHWLAALPQS